MSLEYISKRAEELFSVPPEKRDGQWAGIINNLRAEMVFGVLAEFPSPENVQKKALPFLYRSIEAINSLI